MNKTLTVAPVALKLTENQHQLRVALVGKALLEATDPIRGAQLDKLFLTLFNARADQ